MKNYVQRGDTLTVVAPYTLVAGGGVQVGNVFGIALNNQNSGDNMDMLVTGVFDLVKDTSTFNPGDFVFWNNATKVATSVGAGNLLIGIADTTTPSGTSAPGGSSGDATVRVRLNPSFGAGVALTAIVNLTAAQLIAMNGTPVSVLPAPGAGLALVIDSILFEMTTTSTQFTGGGAVSFNYHGGSTAVHAGSIPASVVTAAAGNSNTLLGQAVAANGTTVPGNTGVDITNATAAFAAGTGTAKVQIRYRAVAL